MDYWEKVYNLETNLIIKPITYINEQGQEAPKIIVDTSGIIFKNYLIKVYFSAYPYCFKSYAEENLKVNPIIPEIQLINLVSYITKALRILKRNNIEH